MHIMETPNFSGGIVLLQILHLSVCIHGSLQNIGGRRRGTMKAIPLKIWVSDPPKSVDPNLCDSKKLFLDHFLGENHYFGWSESER